MNARIRAGMTPASDAATISAIVLPVPASSDLELEPAGYRALSRCISIITAFRAANRAVLVDFDITAQQYACLVEAACVTEDGALSIGELAQRLRIRHNTAVGVVTRLCGKGHMVRSRDEEDRRKVRLEVTHKGRQILDKMVRQYWQTLRKCDPGLFTRDG